MIEVYLRILVFLLRKQGKIYFLKSLYKNVSLLDVGCGNNSPLICKALRPDIYYVGIDVGDYGQKSSPAKVADEYIITTSDEFSDKIATLQNTFDAVISSHNLEHCTTPDLTLRAMLRALKCGGRLYLAFPSEASVLFPKRHGLNFFDDSTHKKMPHLDSVLRLVKSEGFTIDFIAGQYQPKFLSLIGLLLEPLSRLLGKVMVGTWEFYGFETVIWATKTRAVLVEAISKGCEGTES